MPAVGGYDVAAIQEEGFGDGFFGNHFRVTYDFAVLGGAQATIVLPTAQIPANVIVLDGYFDVVTTFTGATNTLAIGLESTNDLLAATAIATYGTIGRHAVIPVNTAATSLKTTVARFVTVTLATANVTAGKMFICLRTLPSGAA
jgi:hypothetical protein